MIEAAVGGCLWVIYGIWMAYQLLFRRWCAAPVIYE